MIGDKIKNLRKEYKLTQGELAEKIGTQQPQVTRWENGRKIPCLDALKKISQIFNISLDSLVFTEKDLKTLKIKDKSLFTKMKDIEKLNERDKEIVINLIASLVEK